MTVDAKDFKDAMSRFASGVTVVTVEHGGEVHGITVSAFISVSLAPPLILVSIDRKAGLHDLIAGAERFTVSMLAADQVDVSNYYAGWRKPEQTVELARTERGSAVVAGALGWIECTQFNAVDGGDHTLFLGRVEAVTTRDGEPLIYFRSRYRALIE
ncbi:MAG: flavin reductase family protein [Myxococcota bacterium]